MTLLKVFDSVRQFFKQRSHLRQAFDTARNAVMRGDAMAFDAVFAQNNFQGPKSRELLLTAIHNDRSDIFQKILDRHYAGNVNHTLHFNESAGPGGPLYLRDLPVLNYAMANGAKKVAQLLLAHPDIDVTIKGHSTSTIYQTGGLFFGGYDVTCSAEEQSALDIARMKGMDDMAQVIRNRGMKP